ncbi:alpha-(1-_3)-arabinofuranosyltransferase domain-containing protein [Corynebacterium accolens]|uniref:alpha-(1->3)-arabinofuranosyltransferase domain-containing protein n=1 Tax=Corynebacterium accolens TaxID=38284 RepID=UPI00254DB88F|nr:alpha-(1->3)-arabinofuranosyltransferase family protein [Corynebacterium accolens]MDK8682571.1 alpha-(1->3)-arabinofuranosyltransferase family protein [Corynebacterium accolens]
MHDRTDQLPRGPHSGAYLHRFRALARALRHRCARLARPYPLGIIALALILAVQPWGLTAADTKHDLAANPRHFLRGALDAYTDIFTLGQLQNQAYGYLFPQGPFFVLTEPLPDWIAQRLWWLLVLSVGFIGFHKLATRIGLRGRWVWVAAMLYALSPRSLSTLTAISSETWPVMLAPWVILPFLREKLTWRDAAAATIPVALMGAVNATATLAACTPALVIVVYRRAFKPGAAWLLGCLCVSAWWIGPLLILGRYAPPFTEFIESSRVTTRWLNLPEILRGTTSWSPFADAERIAGNELATSAFFVLITMAVAAISIYGLCRLPRVWSIMLITGVAILGCQAAWYLDALDGALAPLRNLHKFDPLVRIPLLLGFARACQRLPLPTGLRPTKKQTVGALVLLVCISALSPAWSQRLLPLGAYDEVPGYWHEATDYINEHAENTRTLIYPEASFARQEWGWTRDEPAQPLLDVPWAVRDAIPLVPPEAIRGLDGVMAALDEDPASGVRALQRLGIGAVMVRHDLFAADNDTLSSKFGGEVHTFGEVDVIMLEQHSMALTSADPVRVAGGGEALAFLDAHNGPAARELVDSDADIVTDTPTLVDRNYGTLHGAASAPLSGDDPSHVYNRLRDYPSAGPLTTVETHGGDVEVSSSAADATAFGGAQPEKSATAAVDGENSTAWWPAPGDDEGWIELRGDFSQPSLKLMATSSTTVTVRSGGAAVEVDLQAFRSKTVRVPGGDSQAIRVELSHRTGIAELEVEGHPIERVVTVPDTSPDVHQFFFQQMVHDTGVLIRDVTVPRRMEATVDSTKPVLIDSHRYSPGSTLTLEPGVHRVRTTGAWVSMTEKGWSPPPPSDYQLTDFSIDAADNTRLLITGRAFNEGLRGFVGDTELTPREIDAATQAFIVPAGIDGEFRMTFKAQPAYRAALLFGGALGLAALGFCLLFAARRGPQPTWHPGPGGMASAMYSLACLALVGWPAVLAGMAAWLIVRWTTIPRAYLASGVVAAAGTILARAPWTSGAYAGDSVLLMCLCAAGLACLFAADGPGPSPGPGPSEGRGPGAR